MANYLPVLLVSVSNNTVPDDSSVSTQPRGQVDYLSHDWQEEDIAKSWRNMTRQKNEIANGSRLENASWRTWWKQRNNLKTVSPETLNWLKDSDVTWLYGPLHTAVDWTPPPKPKADPTSVDSPSQSSNTLSRLDLANGTNRPIKQKPILKHRTVSEMLTSDLPSPIFSPVESENESDDDESLTSNASKAAANAELNQRPPLVHTKSDTHITRWGPDRSFRKESPPRIDPTGHVVAEQDGVPDACQVPSVHSGANLKDYFAQEHKAKSSRYGRRSLPHTRTRSSPNSDYSSPARGSPGSNPTPTPGSAPTQQAHNKKKHISFNTFVEQCIAIEKPKGDASTNPWGARKGSFAGGWLKAGIGKDWVNDRDEDSDEEAVPASILQAGSAIESESESSEGLVEDLSDDDGVIKMKTKSAAKKRSKSKASTSSSSSSGSASTTASFDSRARTRLANEKRLSLPGSKYSSRSSSRHLPHSEQHITICPIAPTMLKTNDVGLESPHNLRSPGGSWAENLGDDSFAYGDDGYIYGAIRSQATQKQNGYSNYPVELVYVPPSAYNADANGHGHSPSSDVYDYEAMSPMELQSSAEALLPITTSTDDAPLENFHHETLYSTVESNASRRSQEEADARSSSSVPMVVRTPPTMQNGVEEDMSECFEYSEMVESPSSTMMASRSHSTIEVASDRSQFGGHVGVGRYVEGGAQGVGIGRSKDGQHLPLNILDTPEDRDSLIARGRSQSRSRTPSPSRTLQAVSIPENSTSPTSSVLLSPPLRGRSMARSPDSRSSSRGRSSTRTSSTVSESRSSGSPFSPSISPDGSGIGGSSGSYGAYANGRVRAGRDRERDRGRRSERQSSSGERGRDRSERRMSLSRSPDEKSLSKSESSTSLVATFFAAREHDMPSSSSSSTPTPATKDETPHKLSDVATKEEPAPLDLESEDSVRKSEEQERYRHPTPQNSPVVGIVHPPYMKKHPPSTTTTPTRSTGHSAQTTPTKASSQTSGRVSSDVTKPKQLKTASPTSSTKPLLKSASPTSGQPTAGISTGGSPPSFSEPPPPSAVASKMPSPTGTVKEGDSPTVVGKAVGLVSNAGSYIGGLWSSSSSST